MRDTAIAMRGVPRRLAAGTLVAILLAPLPSLAPAHAVAASPARAAAAYLATTVGGNPEDFTLVYERTTLVPGTHEQVWAGKLVDRRSGQVRIVYRDPRGTLGGPKLLAGKERAAAASLDAFALKASDGLRTAVQRGQASALPVAAWLEVDVTAAEAEVIARHPEVSWLGNRPLGADLATARQLRGELWESRRRAIATAAGAVRAEVERLGGRIAYVSTSAPLLFMDLPPAIVPGLARRTDIATLGLEGSWDPAISTATAAVDADWTGGAADQGRGIRAAVVEYHNVRERGDLAGKVAKAHSTSGHLAYAPGFDHPSWVAGAIAGQGGTYRGVAPGATIISAGTGGYSPSLKFDRAIIAATDWAISPSGGDADLVNTSLVQDTSTGSEEARRYFDSIVERDGRLAISAAGNYVNGASWAIGSPGTGYNVLTVGGVDDRGTAGHADDRIWYVPGSNGSNWFDPPGTSWNGHGDFNKPNLVAPAVAVRTANGLAASGTSVATPIVSGVAAQVLANQPGLVSWPEGTRAVLMAGAIHHVRMPDGSTNVDHEGVGMISAPWASRAAVAGDGQFGGYRIGIAREGDALVQEVQVRAGDRLRVALAWDSDTWGSRNLSLNDQLRADLDLRVTDPSGNAIGSFTFDNAYEFAELAIASSGVARIEVLQTRFDRTAEAYGLAWTKVRDTDPPGIRYRTPSAGEPWAVAGSSVRVTFDEPVEGVSADSLRLVRLADKTRVPATISYSSSSRTAVLASDAALAPGRYEAVARGPITDRAGNALPRITWRFSVVEGDAIGTLRFAGARRTKLDPGTHVGYRFDAAGNVTASKTVDLPRGQIDHAARRGRLPSMPGTWLRMSDGPLRGYWVRESSRAAIRGTAGTVRWPAGRSVVIRAGTHRALRFSSSGAVTAGRSRIVGSTVSSHASKRAVINGARYLRMTDGPWAGYWLPESSIVYVAGMLDLVDLGGGRLRFSAGTRTGYRYRADGDVRGQKTLRPRSSGGARTVAWGIVDGRPAYFVESGGWTGYWLPETSGVSYP